MKKVIEKYYCDVCGREVSNADYLFAVTVPIRQYSSDGRDFSRITRSLGLCYECKNAFYKINERYFAVISDTYGYIDTTVKYKEVNKMSAEEMFEKLGYKFCVTYDKDLNRIDEYRKGIVQVLFFISKKKYVVLNNHMIDAKLHKAIHQQLLELGWIGSEEDVD